MKNNPCAAFLAVFFIRHTNYLDVTHLRVRQIKLFDLTRIEVLTATDNHILQTSGNLVVTILGSHTDIARVQPAICINRLCRCFRHLIITLHDIEAAGNEFAAFAVRKLVTCLRIDNLTFNARERTADGLYTVVEVFVYLTHRTARRSFGLAVYRDNLTHVHLNGCTTHQVCRTVCSCHDTRTHIGEVRLCKIRMVKHRNKHRRHTIETGNVLIIYTGKG